MVKKREAKPDWEKAITRLAKNKNPVVEFMNVELDKKDAKKLLLGNENNRHLNTYLINKYLRLMNTNKWVLNGETIKLGIEGGSYHLLDGQHRLSAIMKADNPIKVSLALGLKPDHFKTIDTGRARSAGDILKIAGYKNVHCLSAAARWLLTYQQDQNLNWTSEISPEDILDSLKRWPKMVHFPPVAERFRFLVQPSITAFIMYVTQSIDPDLSHDFFIQIEYGEHLKKKSPILEFRTIMMRYRKQQTLLDKRYALAYYINTWNAYYNDVEVVTIKWKSGTPFPEIEGVNREKLFRRNSQ